MGIRKTALRLGVVAALTGGGNPANYPTMGQNRFYDSRLDPIHDIVDEERTPLAVITTDENDQPAWENQSGPPFDNKVNLHIEFSLSVFTTNGTDVVQTLTDTDAKLEAALDLFELQIKHALFHPTSVWSAAWRKIIKRVREISILPMRTEDGRTRYSSRIMRLEIDMCDDEYPTLTLNDPPLGATGVVNTQPVLGAPVIPTDIQTLLDFITNNGEPELVTLTSHITDVFNNGGMLPTETADPAILGGTVDFIDPYDPNVNGPGGPFPTTGPDGRVDIDFTTP